MVLFIIIVKRFWNESGSILFKNLNMNSKLCQRLLGFLFCKIMDLWETKWWRDFFLFWFWRWCPTLYNRLYTAISINNKTSKRVTWDKLVFFKKIILWYTNTPRKRFSYNYDVYFCSNLIFRQWRHPTFCVPLHFKSYIIYKSVGITFSGM